MALCFYTLIQSYSSNLYDFNKAYNIKYGYHAGAFTP